MKIIKTITHKLIQASLLVVTGFNFSFATEPKAIIESYANPSESHYKKPGNVLAYKNCVGQTIVLKSGNYFTGIIYDLKDNDNVIVVPLQDVVAIVGENQHILEKYVLETNGLSVNEDDIVFTPSIDEISHYIDLATNGTIEAWQMQFIKHQADRLKQTIHSLEDAKKAVLNNCQENVQNLDQLRHTEFQIHALLNAFLNPKSDKHKALLNLLLPKNITLDEPLDKENSVYSLFEACNSCKLVPWLENNKDFFMFKVLDAQVLKYGKAVLDNFHSQTAAENLQNAITVQVKNSKGKPIEGKTTTMDLFNCNFNRCNEELRTISSYMIVCKHCANNTCTNHSDGFFAQWKNSDSQNSLSKNQYKQYYKIAIKNDISSLLQDIKTFISYVNKAAKTSSKKGAK